MAIQPIHKQELDCFATLAMTVNSEFQTGSYMPAYIDSVSVDAGFDALSYCYENPGATAQDATVRGERWLWSAVITQAFADLENKNERDAAKRWLLHDKTDFPLICWLAGISPLTVRKAALAKCNLLPAHF